MAVLQRNRLRVTVQSRLDKVVVTVCVFGADGVHWHSWTERKSEASLSKDFVMWHKKSGVHVVMICSNHFKHIYDFSESTDIDMFIKLFTACIKKYMIPSNSFMVFSYDLLESILPQTQS